MQRRGEATKGHWCPAPLCIAREVSSKGLSIAPTVIVIYNTPCSTPFLRPSRGNKAHLPPLKKTDVKEVSCEESEKTATQVVLLITPQT